MLDTTAVPSAAAESRLSARDVSLGYDDRIIVDRLSVDIPTGQITVIVGANACGKSTLLRGLARLLKARGGTVLLDGEPIQRSSTREVATKLGILPQQPVAPDGLTVGDLVARGRHPHQRWFRQWSAADEEAVAEALAATDMSDLANRPVDELSGGQRQRAWIAMALAQGTPILLLDEPTTFLDLAHQCEVMDLLQHLNDTEGRTIVAVLHDLNQASRYAHHLIAMKARHGGGDRPPRRGRHRGARRRGVRPGRSRRRRPGHRHAVGGTARSQARRHDGGRGAPARA